MTSSDLWLQHRVMKQGFSPQNNQVNAVKGTLLESLLYFQEKKLLPKCHHYQAGLLVLQDLKVFKVLFSHQLVVNLHSELQTRASHWECQVTCKVKKRQHIKRRKLTFQVYFGYEEEDCWTTKRRRVSEKAWTYKTRPKGLRLRKKLLNIKDPFELYNRAFKTEMLNIMDLMEL